MDISYGRAEAMIHLDTTNSAYDFKREVLACVKKPPGSIRLSEMATLFDLCGDFEIKQAIKHLQKEFAGLSIQRSWLDEPGLRLVCTREAWPIVERYAAEYLERLDVGRMPDDV